MPTRRRVWCEWKERVLVKGGSRNLRSEEPTKVKWMRKSENNDLWQSHKKKGCFVFFILFLYVVFLVERRRFFEGTHSSDSIFKLFCVSPFVLWMGVIWIPSSRLVSSSESPLKIRNTVIPWMRTEKMKGDSSRSVAWKSLDYFGEWGTHIISSGSCIGIMQSWKSNDPGESDG